MRQSLTNLRHFSAPALAQMFSWPKALSVSRFLAKVCACDAGELDALGRIAGRMSWGKFVPAMR